MIQTDTCTPPNVRLKIFSEKKVLSTEQSRKEFWGRAVTDPDGFGN